jgi:hypothetical protein
LRGETLRESDDFIRAYHEFKKQVDLTKGGILPEVEDLICYMLMGIPYVPADDDTSAHAPMTAVEQRVSILKAIFVEANRAESEDFLDEGLRRYDQASEMAKTYLKEGPVDRE